MCIYPKNPAIFQRITRIIHENGAQLIRLSKKNHVIHIICTALHNTGSGEDKRVSIEGDEKNQDRRLFITTTLNDLSYGRNSILYIELSSSSNHVFARKKITREERNSQYRFHGRQPCNVYTTERGNETVLVAIGSAFLSLSFFSVMSHRN